LRTLHHGRQIRRLDFEVRNVALLDLQQNRAGLLGDRGRKAVFLLRRNADDRIRRDQNRFLTAHQQNATIAPRCHGIARFKHGFLGL